MLASTCSTMQIPACTYYRRIENVYVRAYSMVRILVKSKRLTIISEKHVSLEVFGYSCPEANSLVNYFGCLSANFGPYAVLVIKSMIKQQYVLCPTPYFC